MIGLLVTLTIALNSRSSEKTLSLFQLSSAGPFALSFLRSRVTADFREKTPPLSQLLGAGPLAALSLRAGTRAIQPAVSLASEASEAKRTPEAAATAVASKWSFPGEFDSYQSHRSCSRSSDTVKPINSGRTPGLVIGIWPTGLIPSSIQ